MSNQVIEEFDRMTALCHKMEEVGAIDPAILDNIDRAKSTLSALANMLSTNTASSNVKSAFLGYHIIRNLNLILSKMKDRFTYSKDNNDNPIVAEDSLSILPILSESAEVAMKYAGKKVGEGEEELMLNHILKLREITSQANMTLTVEEEAKTISASPEAVRAEEQKLSDAVEQRYAKEENIY
jgi:hypothetical protein